MSNVPMYLPMSYSKTRNDIELKILEFSNTIFENPKIGIFCGLMINCIYVYCWYKKYSLISTCILFYLLYLIFNIIIYQFKKKK